MMTNDEYQKACDIAANYRDVNMSHDQAVGYVYGFKQGVKWANANPSPRVMRLLAGLKYYIDNCDACNFSGIDEAEFSARGCPSCDCLMARKALADFESERE